eukprot:TRINITY_DN12082_c0_g1_i4.p1 TRINITY_DN12082_c0_g1~~TRINITY_DN12082_c0_g1_i4.p1  ORF type:complete len:1543 (+),score=455.96 TRINITY_DN12082_c0_g1_i4:231-4631(+)
MEELLGNVFLDKDGKQLTFDKVKGKTIGVYFWSHTCDICEGFSKALGKMYDDLQKYNFQVVAVTDIADDADEEGKNMQKAFSTAPWVTVPFDDEQGRHRLHDWAAGILDDAPSGNGPTLMIVSPTGELLNKRAMLYLGGGVSHVLNTGWRCPAVGDLSVGPFASDSDVAMSKVLVILAENCSKRVIEGIKTTLASAAGKLDNTIALLGSVSGVVKDVEKDIYTALGNGCTTWMRGWTSRAIRAWAAEAKTAKRHVLCRGIADQIIELSLKVIEHREKTDGFKSSVLGGKPLVPPHTWNEWILQFLTGTGDVEPADELPSQEHAPEIAEADTEAAQEEPQGDDTAACAEEATTAPTPADDPDKDKRQREIEVLKLLNDEEISSYVNHSKGWATVNKPPRGCGFNEHLCEILCKISTFLRPPPPCRKRRDNLFFPLVVVMGKNLSGKSAVAKAISAEFALCTANIKDVLLAALASCNDNVDSLTAGLPEEQVDIVHERIELGRKAKNEQLDQGLMVSDEVLCRLMHNHIKWCKARSVVPAASDESIPMRSPQGMLLEGFPRTVEQFKIMESLLTTYEIDKTAEDKDYQLAPKKYRTPVVLPTVVQSSTGSNPVSMRNTPEVAEEEEGEGSLPQVTPIQPLTAEEEELLAEPDRDETAFDLVLNIDVTDSEILARYAGERFDPVTNIVYHMTYNPPADDVVPRLQTVDKGTRNTELLHSKLTTFRRNKKRIIAWLDDKQNFKEIDGNAPLDEVTANALEVARQVMDEKRKEDDKRCRIKKLHQFVADEKQRFEQEVSARKEALQQGSHEPVHEPVGPKKAPIELSSEINETLNAQWEESTQLYEQGLSEVLVELRKLRKDAVEHLIVISQQFDAHLLKPSNRQAKVEAFQQEFNAFDAELRRDSEGMAELHLYTDNLQSELWKECDHKKESADMVIQEYTKASWNDLYKNSVQVQFCALIELEVTRFIFTKRLVQFYYGALYCCALKSDEGLPDLMSGTDEPSKGGKKDKKPPPKGKGKDPEPEEKAIDEFTRVYKKAIEWIEEITSPEPEKEAKPKDTKVASPVMVSEWEQAAESLVDVAASREWELLRYRLEIICSKYYSFIDDFNEKSAAVYERLAAKLGQMYKQEMSAVATLLSHIRRCIEEQTPLLYALDLTGKTVALDESHLLVPLTEVHELEVSDVGDGGDFVTPNLTKDHVLGIISRFRGRSPKGLVSKDDFVRLFLQMAATTTGEENIPKCWQEYGKENFEKAFASFDWLNKGACDWRSFCTSLLLWSNDTTKLWKVSHPSLTELTTLKLNFKEVIGDATHVTRADFLSIAFWFEDSASATRSQQLKALLWEIFKTDSEGGTEVIDVTTFFLYLCSDKQILRGGQKALAMMSQEEGFVTRDDLYKIFHYSPYSVCEDAVDDMYSKEGIDSVFNSILERVGFTPEEAATGVITFAQLCAWHVGRVMLNSASMYLLRSVVFE